MKVLKIATVSLLFLNALPLLLYPWVVVPAIQIIRLGAVAGEPPSEAIFRLGFAWGAALFPVMLLFNHWCSVRNLRKGDFNTAFQHQLMMIGYLAVLATFGLATM